MDDLVQKYRNGIPKAELTEAFKIYYDTKDLKIREQIIYRYMPLVKKMVLNFNITSIEEEDLVQMAYEILIKCVDKYNPYSKVHFYILLHQRISQINTMYNTNNKKENISLSNIDIYSNEDLESNIESKITTDELFDIIKDILDKYPNKNISDIFKKLYGIDSKIMTPVEINKELNISQQRISQVKNIILLHLFLKLSENYNYYPSKEIQKFLYDFSPYWTAQLPKETLVELKEISLYELDYLEFYDDCNSLENSHQLVKK